MPEEKKGDNAPAVVVNAKSVASVDIAAALVTVIVYVLIVVASCAVPNIVMVLLPTFNAIEPEALPLVTVIPFTLTVAFI